MVLVPDKVRSGACGRLGALQQVFNLRLGGIPLPPLDVAQRQSGSPQKS